MGPESHGRRHFVQGHAEALGAIVKREHRGKETGIGGWAGVKIVGGTRQPPEQPRRDEISPEPMENRRRASGVAKRARLPVRARSFAFQAGRTRPRAAQRRFAKTSKKA